MPAAGGSRRSLRSQDSLLSIAAVLCDRSRLAVMCSRCRRAVFAVGCNGRR